MDICFYCDSQVELITTNCGHEICHSCFGNYFQAVRIHPLPCPVCSKSLSDEYCEFNLGQRVDDYREVRAHYQLIKDKNKYQCYNEDCTEIFQNDGSEIESFICSGCNKKTCLKCRALHTANETCDDWERNNEGLVKSRKYMAKDMKRQVKCGHGMTCEDCGCFIIKLENCDGILCPRCKLPLCFKKKMRRWGPKGVGDLSGGCRCYWDGKTPCHPRCKGCH